MVLRAAQRWLVKGSRGTSRVTGTTATVDRLETMCFFASGVAAKKNTWQINTYVNLNSSCSRVNTDSTCTFLILTKTGPMMLAYHYANCTVCDSMQNQEQYQTLTGHPLLACRTKSTCKVHQTLTGHCMLQHESCALSPNCTCRQMLGLQRHSVV